MSYYCYSSRPESVATATNEKREIDSGTYISLREWFDSLRAEPARFFSLSGSKTNSKKQKKLRLATSEFEKKKKKNSVLQRQEKSPAIYIYIINGLKCCISYRNVSIYQNIELSTCRIERVSPSNPSGTPVFFMLTLNASFHVYQESRSFVSISSCAFIGIVCRPTLDSRSTSNTSTTNTATAPALLFGGPTAHRSPLSRLGGVNM